MSDFYDWKRHPITVVVFGEFETRVKFLLEQLVENASSSTQAELAEKAGIIKGYRDLLNISAEDFKQETE